MIEAVITCVDYDDYLEQTLPITRKFVDRLVVATSPLDWKTIAICSQNGVECIRTDAFQKDGAIFRKGAGINVALKQLSRADWILHLDADTLVNRPIGLDNLEKDCIWTVPRVRIVGGDEFRMFKEFGNPIPSRKPEPFLYSNKRFYASGYFQLWHFPTCQYWYNEVSLNASKCDWRFCENWIEQKRKVISNLVCYHLEMLGDKKADNWYGRKTPRFA